MTVDASVKIRRVEMLIPPTIDGWGAFLYSAFLMSMLESRRPNIANDHSNPPCGPTDTFVRRHLGPSDADIASMLADLGFGSLEELVNATIPASIRVKTPLTIDDPTNPAGFRERGEHETLVALRALASRNQVWRSYIGTGYVGTITPGVILRNVLESPAWYTAYTPYQPEISQGRLEALLNFQTMICELTGLPVANASMLDEGSAAAEAMTMCLGIAGSDRRVFFVADTCHPQTIAVVQTRASGVGVEVVVGDPFVADFSSRPFAGVLIQYPDTNGLVTDWTAVAARAHAAGAQVVAACDPLALTLFAAPSSWGADIAVGSAQRFGVPIGFGGPHAGFMATKIDHVRRMPGRLVGVSRDKHGAPAMRLAIQTREQHIKRDRATSNICTAQVLLAVMAGLYGAYHGPDGLVKIARRVHSLTSALAAGLRRIGHDVGNGAWFDTLRVRLAGTTAASVVAHAASLRMNLRVFTDGSLGVTLDETTTTNDLEDLLASFAAGTDKPAPKVDASATCAAIPTASARTGTFMTQDVFNIHHSETDLLRYIKRLESKDLSLCHSMIPLGSCTMKLNATSELLPVTWPEFGQIHPFAPREQWTGYAELFRTLERWLENITGFAAVSLQPNAGSQGEYAGLMAIRAYHASRGESRRTTCLIPESAHGTNPASAVVAGMKVVPVKCDAGGNIDLADMRAKAGAHASDLAACMVTYPSTHGVFEEGICELCEIVHECGGQVYLDGANLNALVGLVRPGEIGADVCHLNLHKTFCIPHGGGGPGVGPIGVAAHLAPFLPGHPVSAPLGAHAGSIGPVSAAPYGSASILPVSWMYIALMGAHGLTRASEVAILNANYAMSRLHGHYRVVYVNHNGRCAHECIVDCREFEASSGIRNEDIAKRLMDYGFHAPTMSWPVPGTLMIEPTESESKEELDRFCDALISIRNEIREIETGAMPRDDNPLKGAPHTAAEASATTWAHPYSREQAVYPASWLRQFKFWPAVGRVDNPYGDRNLVCTCDGVSAYT